jgi:hypothetical protein
MEVGQWHTIMTLYAYVKFQIKISDIYIDMKTLSKKGGEKSA